MKHNIFSKVFSTLKRVRTVYIVRGSLKIGIMSKRNILYSSILLSALKKKKLILNRSSDGKRKSRDIPQDILYFKFQSLLLSHARLVRFYTTTTDRTRKLERNLLL